MSFLSGRARPDEAEESRRMKRRERGFPFLPRSQNQALASVPNPRQKKKGSAYSSIEPRLPFLPFSSWQRRRAGEKVWGETWSCLRTARGLRKRRSARARFEKQAGFSLSLLLTVGPKNAPFQERSGDGSLHFKSRSPPLEEGNFERPKARAVPAGAAG